MPYYNWKIGKWLCRGNWFVPYRDRNTGMQMVVGHMENHMLNSRGLGNKMPVLKTILRVVFCPEEGLKGLFVETGKKPKPSNPWSFCNLWWVPSPVIQPRAARPDLAADWTLPKAPGDSLHSTISFWVVIFRYSLPQVLAFVPILCIFCPGSSASRSKGQGLLPWMLNFLGLFHHSLLQRSSPA